MCEPGKENDKHRQHKYHKGIPAAPAFEEWYFIFCLHAVKLRVNAIKQKYVRL